METVQNNQYKLKILASFFKHKVKDKNMTYIFLIDSENEIKRAEVPLEKGLPIIKKTIKWEYFSNT